MRVCLVLSSATQQLLTFLRLRSLQKATTELESADNRLKKLSFHPSANFIFSPPLNLPDYINEQASAQGARRYIFTISTPTPTTPARPAKDTKMSTVNTSIKLFTG